MEIEKIVSTLREKVGQTSLSDRSITDYINAFKPAEGTEPDDAFFTLHAGILKSFSGNLSHDTADQVNAFKAQWEKDHPVTTPSTPATPPVNTSADNDMKAVLERLAALENKKPETDPNIAKLSEQLSAIASKMTADTEQKQIQAVMTAIQGRASELKVEDAPTWELAVEMVTPKIKADTTAEDAEKLVKSQYESLIKRLHPGGAKPYGDGDGSNTGSPVQKWLEDLKKRDEAREAARKAVLDSLK